MSHLTVVLCGFGLAGGLPAYYIIIKRRAEASLRTLLADRFCPRACPVDAIPTPRGPVAFREAYDDRLGTGLVLMLGYWRRSRTAYNLVAALFKPGGTIDMTRADGDRRRVLITANVNGGDLVVWKGLPSRDAVLGHLKAVC